MVELKLSFSSIDEAIAFLTDGQTNVTTHLRVSPQTPTQMPLDFGVAEKVAEEPVRVVAVTGNSETTDVVDYGVPTGVVPRKKPGRKPKAESEQTAQAQVADAQEPSSPENSASVEADAPSAVPAVADEPVAAESAVAPARNVTADDVRDALKKLASSKGIAAVGELLAKFGVNRVSELADDKLAEVLEAAQ